MGRISTLSIFQAGDLVGEAPPQKRLHAAKESCCLFNACIKSCVLTEAPRPTLINTAFESKCSNMC